jgi:hypothetical protein
MPDVPGGELVGAGQDKVLSALRQAPRPLGIEDVAARRARPAAPPNWARTPRSSPGFRRGDEQPRAGQLDAALAGAGRSSGCWEGTMTVIVYGDFRPMTGAEAA